MAIPPAAAAFGTAIQSSMEGGDVLALTLLVVSDDTALLAHARFERCLVATYADLFTPELVERFPDRLLALDRGRGDPLECACVAYMAPGGLSIADGIDRLREWQDAGKVGTVAYVPRHLSYEHTAVLTGLKPLWWTARGRYWAGPDGRRAAIADLPGRSKPAGRVRLAAVMDAGLRALASTPPAEASGVIRWQYGEMAVVGWHAAHEVAGR